VKRHTEFTEFSASLLNEFISKVFVHEAVRINGVRTQDIEIFFTFIGKFEVPEMKIAETEITTLPITEHNPAQEIPTQKQKQKKLRRFMTEEERARERERDRIRYAVKRNARIAIEQEQRAAILQGTSFAV